MRQTRIYIQDGEDQVSPGICELDDVPPAEMRLVIDTKTGEWDALNLPEDQPTPNEHQFKGVRTSYGMMCQRGGDGYSGPFVIYRVVPR